MTRFFNTLAIVLVVLLCAPIANAQKRAALVIGIDNYLNIESLQKAVNDAEAISASLAEVGFRVTTAKDVTRRDMNRVIQEFASQLSAGDEAVFFFAGHGIEISGRNYLLPTDTPAAKPGQEQFIKAEAIPVDQILETIQNRGTRVSVLMLDACRNNPFPSNGTRSLGSSRGLAGTIAPEGTLILYSAGVGQTALDRLSDDDQNPNSVFTRSLIPLLKQPGLSHVQLARQVRRDVMRLAATVSHQQRPAYYDEVTSEYFFSGQSGDGNQAQVRPVPQQIGDDALVWESIKNTDSVAVLRTFIERFPDSAFVSFARARVSELNAQSEKSALLNQADPQPRQKQSPDDKAVCTRKGPRWADVLGATRYGEKTYFFASNAMTYRYDNKADCFDFQPVPTSSWQGLGEHAKKISAVLDWSDINGKLYFFLNDGNYVRFNKQKGRIDVGPKSTGSSWPGLGPYARKIISATTWNNNGKTYFFLNDGTYVRYDNKSDSKEAGPSRVERGWKGVGKYARKIVAAIDWQAMNGKTYFFLNDGRYLRYGNQKDALEAVNRSSRYWP